MRIATSFIVLLSAAATNAQFYNETSKPFYLILSSSDTSVNGSTLSACHTGAALESLCLSNSSTTSNPDPIAPATFNFNTSSNIPTANETLGTRGILTWTLQSGSGDIPSSVYFNYDPTADTTVPILAPGSENAQLLAFDDQNMLNVQGYIDWTANPPNATANTVAERKHEQD
ncbi:hypothetical protein N0V94_007511 [Neodidymelliopsis sp. IMI 364377]|nr:hypothetical protein N0V94_007511 [Neodidymelliopsis sp. IMI 364377]